MFTSAIRLTVLAAIALAPVSARSMPAVVDVPNPSFEEARPDGKLPLQWSGDASVFALDTGVARTGKASLRIANTDPAKYRLCSTKIRLAKGKRYEFSVWVKTKDVKGADSGATICIEWSGADGKWLGGSYPRGFKGTSVEWRQVKGVTRPIPDAAAKCTITCYLRKGMTGAAWFDDVKVKRYRGPFMETMLTSPSYRGWFVAGQTRQFAVRVALNLGDYDLGLRDVALKAEVLNADGKAVRNANLARVVANPADLPLPAAGLPAGKYVLRITAKNKVSGKTLATAEHEVRPPDTANPTCYIDEHRRVILNGKPFFPLGMYWGSINEKDIKTYADSAFNCLMPYGRPTPEQMDLAQKFGLKVIYSIKDFYAGTKWSPGFIKTQADEEPAVRKYVEQFRNHPALLAWYLNDELPLSMMPRLVAHQQWIERLDPNHPTWVVLYQVHDVGRYTQSFDVIGTDPYPIPKSPASRAAEWTRLTVGQTAGCRGVWQVPQVFNWANYRKTPEQRKGLRPPTLPEMRSMAWQCITEGATGLVFYSFMDLKRDKATGFEPQWQKVKTMAAEIGAMIPTLLSIEPAPAVRVAAGDWLHWTARLHNGKLCIMAVNDGDGEGVVKFTLPKPPQTITVLNENRVLAPQGPSFTDRFDKLAVHIYEVEL